MKIRTQNLLTIVPLFLGLALIGSLLMYTVGLNEIRWGLHEEASTLAIAAAEFLDGDAYQGLVRRGTADPYYARIQDPLRRLLKRNQARRVTAYSPDGEKVVFHLSADTISADTSGASDADSEASPSATLSAGVAGEAGLMEAMTRDRFLVGAMRYGEGNQAALTAYAPINDSAGKLAGIVGVETDADIYRKSKQDLLTRGVWLTGIVFLLGILVASLLTRLITREVHALNLAAVEVTAGNLNRQIQAGRIQEIEDLGNTFNTMSDVLRDVLSKTRRALIEGEQFRTEANLAQAYREQFAPPLRASLGAARVAAEHFGARPTGSFYDAFSLPDGACALVGRVGEGASLDAVMTASAARSLLRQDLERLPPEEVFASAGALFPLDRLEIVVWKDGGPAKAWRLDPETGTARRRELPTEPILLHTFDAATGARIEQYARLFGHLSPEDLMTDIRIAVSADREGCLLILKRT